MFVDLLREESTERNERSMHYRGLQNPGRFGGFSSSHQKITPCCRTQLPQPPRFMILSMGL